MENEMNQSEIQHMVEVMFINQESIFEMIY